jgi:O-antigen/teichoic acid export membrane protein
MSGTAVSQGILIFATPILTRIFTPENFGIFALYLSIVGTLSLISSWKYELAIMLPKKREDAEALVFLSIIITVFTSLLAFVILLLFKVQLIKNVNNISFFLFLIPIGILLNGLLQIYNAWGARNEQFKFIANSNVVKSGITVGSQLLFAFVKVSSLSLIYGNVVGVLASLTYIVYKTSKKHFIHLSQISKETTVENLIKYKNLPKYQSASVFINSLSQHLPIFLLAIFYSPEIAGFYALTRRALTNPARLLGNSVRQVFFQRASKLFSENKDIKTILSNSTFGLIKISIIPIVLVALFGQPIFVIIFGSNWLISGIFAQIIVVYVFALTVNAPSVMTLQILGKQKFSMIYEIILATFRFLSIYIGYVLYQNYFISVVLFSIVGIVFNVFLIMYVYRSVDKHTQIS